MGISALISGSTKFSTGREPAHQHAQGQADRNRKAEADQHAIERGGGVQKHGAVGERSKQRARDGGKRGRQGFRKIATAGERLIERRGDDLRQRPAPQRDRSL
jgi:hypothetical protein